MEKTNSRKELSPEEVKELENLDPSPDAVDIRQRVPDLLLMLGLDSNKLLRDAGFNDDQIKDIYLAFRKSPCFISINFNEAMLNLNTNKDE